MNDETRRREPTVTRYRETDRLAEGPETYETYAAIPDDGSRYEVVNGHLERMLPGPSTPHQAIGGELEFILKGSCRSEYVIFDAPLDVILGPKDVRQPDIVMIRRDRMSIVTRRGIEGAPDLVVEIMSPGSRQRDKVSKSRTYAKYGVPEYWIVDPEAQTLERYMLQAETGAYLLEDVFEGDDIVVSDKLPCVSFPVKEIFAQIPEFAD